MYWNILFLILFSTDVCSLMLGKWDMSSVLVLGMW